MIVKIKNFDGSWNYYEGDSIDQEIMTANSDCPSTAIWITVPGGGKQISICIEKERKVIYRIITNRPTYLLNDNGKTIDKLI